MFIYIFWSIYIYIYLLIYIFISYSFIHLLIFYLTLWRFPLFIYLYILLFISSLTCYSFFLIINFIYFLFIYRFVRTFLHRKITFITLKDSRLRCIKFEALFLIVNFWLICQRNPICSCHFKTRSTIDRKWLYVKN